MPSVNATPTPIDRVLSTRMETMQLVLDGLRDLSKDVATARKGLDDLGTQVDAVNAPLASASKLAGTLAANLAGMATQMETYRVNKNPVYLVDGAALREEVQRAEDLKKELDALRQFVAIDAYNAIDRLRRWNPLSSPKVAIDFSRDSTDEVVAGLSAARQDETPWLYYLKKVEGACEDVLGQYVDLVGGIALRDHGLDRRLIRHADALVAVLVDSFGGAGALAVPSRHTPEALIQAQHIRIPLPPGWTLWSLPLVARGVGELMRAQSGEPATLHLLPDAFGTFVIGPAYAFAAVLFELDPRTVADQQRARSIFYVLRATGRGDDSKRFDRLADELEAEWDLAVAAVAHAPAPGRGQPMRAVGRPNGSSGGAGADPSEFERAYQRVESKCENAAYLAEDRWDGVQTLSDLLISPDAQASHVVALRDLLNAMWLARWDHPDALATIERQATHLAEAEPGTKPDEAGIRSGAARGENR